MKKYDFTVALLALTALALAGLACRISAGGPEYPKTAIPVSTEAIGSLDQQIQTAQTAAASQDGLITVSITETQITSLLAARLAEQTDPFITDPQAYLRDGQIQLYGTAHQGNVDATVRIILSATVDDQGKPVISVVSTDFGPIPAPEGLNNTISGFIGELFTGSLGPAATGLRLDSISIADGVMTLTGKIQ
jgi:hypothetical protein